MSDGAPAAPAARAEIEISDVGSDAEVKTLSLTKSFVVTWTDPDTGRTHVGTFTAKRPTLGMLGQIGVLRAKMNGGERVDPQVDFHHQMMADLQFILTDVPDWWKPADFFTATPLRKVWDHVVVWINSFRGGGAG